MRIDRVELESFMGHAATEIRLPARGVVLVTGPNGAGKSAIVEAVAHAVWGKALRGSPGWQVGEQRGAASVVQVRSGDLSIRRQRTRSGSKLSLARGASSDQYATATAAQFDVDAVVPPFDVWRRSCVLSSSDAAHFTGASDGERKRFLERALGLDRLDDAHKRAKEDLRAAEAKAHEARRVRDQAAADLETRREALQGARDGLAASPDPGDPAPLRARLRKAEERGEAVEADILGTEARRRESLDARAQVRAQLGQVEHRAALLAGEKCPTCERPIDEDMRERLKAGVAEAKRQGARIKEEADEADEDLGADLEDLKMELRTARRDRDLARDAIASTEAARAQRARWAEVVRAGEERLTKGEEKLAELERELEAADLELEEVRAAAGVLGLKGVRGQLLADALDAIQRSATAWLRRLMPERKMVVRLATETELKSGKVADAISLSIGMAPADEAAERLAGALTWRDYASASAGERRRVDVAILFALAEVARASHGEDDWTIWADEVFDALDVDGVEACVAALQDLAERRCVVVISHNGALQQRVEAVAHVRVRAGRVE